VTATAAQERTHDVCYLHTCGTQCHTLATMATARSICDHRDHHGGTGSLAQCMLVAHVLTTASHPVMSECSGAHDVTARAVTIQSSTLLPASNTTDLPRVLCRNNRATMCTHRTQCSTHAASAARSAHVNVIIVIIQQHMIAPSRRQMMESLPPTATPERHRRVCAPHIQNVVSPLR
jgi:hypothetical protein